MTLTDAHAELVESLDERVRALVRSEGVTRSVVRPVLEDGAWVVVEEWLPVGLLDPA